MSFEENDIDYKRMINELFKALKEKGITCYRISKELDIDKGELSKNKSCKTPMPSQRISRICRKYEIKIKFE